MEAAPSAQELTKLMTQAKHGDKQAFALVYQTCFLPVYRYIYRRVGRASDAEDLSQAVFIKVYTSASQFVGQGKSPLAYLFTIARNSIIDQWKKNNRQPEVSLETNDKDLSAENQPIAEKTDVDAALAKLSFDRQQVLRLKFYEGYSTIEIAGKLNKTTAAIRQIQCRALQELRVLLIT